MLLKVKGLLFDLDGTLLDTAPEFTHCLNLLLNSQGMPPITVTALRSFVSFGASGMLEFGLNLNPQHPKFTVLKEQFLNFYRQGLGNLSSLFSGIPAILETIQLQNLPWGIVTNKPQCFTDPLVQKFSPLRRTQCIVSGDTLLTSKPDPAPLLYACEILKISPKNCWYIGDAKSDVEAAHRSGMQCAIAKYGYIPQNEDPLTWQPDRILSHPEEIKQLL